MWQLPWELLKKNRGKARSSWCADCSLPLLYQSYSGQCGHAKFRPMVQCSLMAVPYPWPLYQLITKHCPVSHFLLQGKSLASHHLYHLPFSLSLRPLQPLLSHQVSLVKSLTVFLAPRPVHTFKFYCIVRSLCSSFDNRSVPALWSLPFMNVHSFASILSYILTIPREAWSY